MIFKYSKCLLKKSLNVNHTYIRPSVKRDISNKFHPLMTIISIWIILMHLSLIRTSKKSKEVVEFRKVTLFYTIYRESVIMSTVTGFLYR